MADVTEVRIVTYEGVVHRAFEHNGVLFTAEGDNVDTMKGHQIIRPTEGPGAVAFHDAKVLQGDFCQRCFKDDD